MSKSDPAAVFPVMRMTSGVRRQIQQTIGTLPPETGGILGGSLDDYVVRYFALDEFAIRSMGSYSPDCDFLNKLLEEQWNPRQIRMLGFVHSHPGFGRRPSKGDLVYAARILECNPSLEQLLLPIVISQAHGGSFTLLPFRALREDDELYVEELRLEVLEETPAVLVAISHDLVAASDEASEADVPKESEASAVADAEQRSASVAADFVPPQVTFDVPASAPSLAETFCRVKDAYDLNRLGMSRVIVVGVGGAREFVQNLARTGVPEFVLIDPDAVSESNLATQHVYRREVGRRKVECLRDAILDIHPQAVVRTRQSKLEDVDDGEFARLATEPWREWDVQAASLRNVPELDCPVEVCLKPAVSLLCGFTDDFYAQARINCLGLQLGLPTLCAQVYAQGLGGEVTFTYPGVTPACHRCVLRGRYEAYLGDEYSNSVTSNGTPIFATSRLNATKGFVAMSLLHHGTDHPRWGDLLERIGNRNLVQIRMTPDSELEVFRRVFGGGDRERIFFDDVVWLPQQPDHPTTNGLSACPDCGGSGDLRDSIGRIADTRTIEPYRMSARDSANEG